MRAHFAGDNEDSVDKIEPVPEPLETRIDEFKQNTQNMEVLNEFVDDVLHKAETEVSKQQDAKNGKSLQQQPKEKRQSFAIPDFKNGKVVNRARGFVVRIFDAICNCANTAAGPAQRIKLRAKRATSTANGNGNAGGGGGGSIDAGETKEKLKKQENGKEKKNDKKKSEAAEELKEKDKVAAAQPAAVEAAKQ